MKKIHLPYLALMFFVLSTPGYAATSNSQTGNGAMESMQEAQQELNQAGKEFSKQASAPGQSTNQKPFSEALSEQQNATIPETVQRDPREQALQGSPETGYAGTWTDPATGDVITSVIAPAPRPDQNQNYPIIIEPQVSGGNYGGNYNQNWSQWQTSPDNPGYPDNYAYTGRQRHSSNQHYPGWMPPYPGQPYPGFNPYPGMNYPPGWWQHQGNANWGSNGPNNFHPGYRPLTPPQANQNWNRPQWPGQNQPLPPNQAPSWGQNPGNSWRPNGNMPPMQNSGNVWWPSQGNTPPIQNSGNLGWSNQGGMASGVQNPGGLWQPGMTLPAAPNRPGPAPIPLRPAGNTWNNSPFAPKAPAGGMFGHPGTRRGF